MDRLKDCTRYVKATQKEHLHSSMDRLKGYEFEHRESSIQNLHSSMDRLKAVAIAVFSIAVDTFTFQYG